VRVGQAALYFVISLRNHSKNTPDFCFCQKLENIPDFCDLQEIRLKSGIAAIR
jgi:hypothetical protein